MVIDGRTATVAIDKGMPLEQEQKLLGYEKIDTTLHYAMVKQSNGRMLIEIYRISQNVICGVRKNNDSKIKRYMYKNW